jgi:hypothetical protein
LEDNTGEICNFAFDLNLKDLIEMSNWLEEAESSIAFGNDHDNLEEKILNKKESIQKNYLANQSLYDNFIQELKSLSKRINKLPAEYREPFGKISFHVKDSKLDNQLHYLSSSTRIKKRMFKSIFHFFKTYTFKRVRVAYFTISSEMGKIDVELKENMLLRMRMTRTGENERLKDPRRKKKDRKDYRFRLDLNNINGDESRDILDWLAYKKEMEEILFFAGEFQIDSPLSS